MTKGTRRISYSTYKGCALPDDHTKKCPALKKLVISKKLIYNEDLQLCLPNSTRPLYRIGNQTLVEAYDQATWADRRMRKSSSKLVTIDIALTNQDSIYHVVLSAEDSDNIDYKYDQVELKPHNNKESSNYEESTRSKTPIPISHAYAVECSQTISKWWQHEFMGRVYVLLAWKEIDWANERKELTAVFISL